MCEVNCLCLSWTLLLIALLYAFPEKKGYFTIKNLMISSAMEERGLLHPQTPFSVEAEVVLEVTSILHVIKKKVGHLKVNGSVCR